MSHLEEPIVAESNAEIVPQQQASEEQTTQVVDQPTEDAAQEEQTTGETTTEEPSTQAESIATSCDLGGDEIQNMADEFQSHMTLVQDAHSKFLERLNKLKAQMGDHDCCKKVQSADEAAETKKVLDEKRISDILEKIQAAREAAEALLA